MDAQHFLPSEGIDWSGSQQRVWGYRLQNSGKTADHASAARWVPHNAVTSWFGSSTARGGITTAVILGFVALTTSVAFATIAGARYAIGSSQTRRLLAAEAVEDMLWTQQYHRHRLLVTFHDKPQDDATVSTVLPGELELKEVIDNSFAGTNSSSVARPEDLIYVGNVPEGQDAADYLDETLAHARVKHVELDALLFTHASETSRATLVHPDDQFFNCDGNGVCGGASSRVARGGGTGQQWGLPRIGAPEAWAITKGSKDVKVGIIDTGISLHHEDLQANINGQCEDFANNDHNCDEGSMAGGSKGHGTFLAGIIAATTNNAKGIAGVAWEADVIGCTMFSDNCRTERCAGSTSAAIKCLNWLRNKKGVRIIANSYGCSVEKVQNCYSANFEKAIASFRDQGGLFVVSAGNEGSNNDKVKHYPAGYNVENVLTMTSTGITKGPTFWDNANPEHLTKNSNYGKNSVDMAAPGQDVISTWAPASNMCGGDPQCYARITGTSAAVPFAVGAAVLISSMPNAPSDGVAIKKLLMDTADPLPFLTSRVKSGARLNVYNALLALQNGKQGQSAASKQGLSKQASNGKSPKPKTPQGNGYNSSGKKNSRKLMNEAETTEDEVADTALRLQLIWEAEQRQQLLRPPRLRSVSVIRQTAPRKR